MSGNRQPLVSVIMNCYNSETWLREAIDSVFAQTYQNWEIVFWDNASTDRSGEIATSYGQRLRYFRGRENVVLGAARKLAVEQARGEYLALLDCDDVLLPDTLSRQVAAMEGGDYALAYGSVVHMTEDGRELKRITPRHRSGNLFDALARQFDIWVPTTVLRTSALRESGLSFDPRIVACEEYCLFMQLAARYRFCVIDGEPLARYRVHEKALTNASLALWAEEREYTLGLIERSHPGIRERYPAAFRHAYARTRYYRARYHVARGERRLAAQQMLPIVGVDPRYLALFPLLFLPVGLWNWVHELRHGRRRYAAA